VKKSLFRLLPVILGLYTALATAQARPNFPTPPESLDPAAREAKEKSPSTPSRHVDPAELQNQADELARTAQTIPADVASVRKGMLPKDVIEKLKQIEKLSKRLRAELNP